MARNAEAPVPPPMPMALRNGTSDLGPPLFLTPSVETPGPLLTSNNNGSKLKQARLLFLPAKSPPPMCAEKSHGATNHIEEKEIPQDTSAENPSHETPMDTSGPNIEDVVPETTGNSLSLPADEKMDTWEVAGSIEGDGSSLQDKTEPGTPDCKEAGSKAIRNTAKAQKAKLSKPVREGALKAERKQAKEEARAKREAEKQRKEQKKREHREKREQEERERREKREHEEQEKKERKEKREEERKKKEEERKKKEEERNQKLEAKRKKDEEKRQLEEQAKEEKLRKEQMTKSKFLGFFPKLPKESPPKKENLSNQDSAVFTPFSIQPGMTLAKFPQPPIKDKTLFDTALENQDFSSVYIQECKSKKLHPDSMSKSKPQSPSQVVLVPDTDEDVVILMSSPQPSSTQAARNVTFKLLQFHENHRPAYYGTVCRRSQLISPRNPFRKDKHLMDYEVDSDDEWEEEEPGESISESEGEEESGEDSDEDDGFFVPHGYLSEDEGENSDKEEESRKQKQLAKATAWEAEFARKCQPLKAVVKVGCVWHRMGVEQPSRDELFLQQFAAMALVELPIRIDSTQASSGNGNGSADSTRRPVPEEAMTDLIRLVHESSMGLNRLIKTFRTHWGAKVTAEQEKSKADNPLTISAQPNEVPKTPQSQPDYESASGISKRQLEMKIAKIAAKEQRATSYKPLWYVHDSVLQQYGLEASTITTLVPLASPFSKPQLCDSEKIKMTSPETPYSGITKKGTKRRVDSTPSVKSLFQALTKSPKINAEQPKEKKPRLSADTDKSGCVDPVHASTAQSLLKHFNSQMPPNKPHPLPTCSDQHRPSGQEVIVILTDDSSNDSPESPISKKENAVTKAASVFTTPNVPPPHTTAALCKAAKTLPCSEALQECTNQSPRQADAAVVQMAVQQPEHSIDWQKLMASSNKVVTSADVH